MTRDLDGDGEPETELTDPVPLRRRRRPRPLREEGRLRSPGELPAPAPASRRIHRSRRERLIGGVCGGIARAYGLDPTLVRALAVLAAFVGGAGIAGYLVGLFLFPLEPRAWATPRPEQAPRQDPALVWAGLLLVAAGLAVLAWIPALEFRLFTLDRGALWPALLIALAVLALRRRRPAPSGGVEPVTAYLSRPRQDRILFGVASGFARLARIDANLVRLTFAIVALWSYGIGALLYLTLAAFLPLDRSAGL